MAFHHGKISWWAASNVHDTWWVLYWSAATDTQSPTGQSASSDSAVNMCQPRGRPASTYCTEDVQLSKEAVFFLWAMLPALLHMVFHGLFTWIWVSLRIDNADLSETSCLVKVLTSYHEEPVNLGQVYTALRTIFPGILNIFLGEQGLRLYCTADYTCKPKLCLSSNISNCIYWMLHGGGTSSSLLMESPAGETALLSQWQGMRFCYTSTSLSACDCRPNTSEKQYQLLNSSLLPSGSSPERPGTESETLYTEFISNSLRW